MGSRLGGFPFTAAQWKELETQAMIYKYMVASLPVPYQLLLPIIQNLPASHSPPLRYSSIKQDVEAGRCKRTDGKKWRCSRDVAPNQKYCERHMHRGRPRSRKHVELSKNPTNAKVLGSTILPSSATPFPFPFFLHNMQSNKQRGCDSCSMEGGSEQQTTSRCIFNNDFGESFTPGRRDSLSGVDLSMGKSPLAEVFCSSSSAAPYPSYPTGDRNGDGDGDGSVSSPSQRTMLSDGSVCNSPTVTATPTDTVAFQCFT